MDILKHFTIEAAHYLPKVPPDHKCRRMHGHSFRITLHVRGEVDEDKGWVMDFSEISGAFKPLFAQLDHNCLNDIDGLDNPTSENLARWIWDRMATSLPALHKVEVHETCTSGCVYHGPVPAS